MGITMTVTGRLGKPERPSFLSRRAHLLTTCEAGGVIPPCGRAVRSSRSIHRMLLQRGQPMPQVFKPPPLPVRLAEGLLPRLPPCSKPLSPPGPSRHPPAKTCHRQLYRRNGRCLSVTVHFLSFRQKKQNRPLQGGRKEVKDYGNLSPGSQGGKPWGRPFCLRCFRLP